MSPAAVGEEGFYRRLTQDADLAALLGAGTRVFPGFPADILTEQECPRVTFYVFGPAPSVKGIQRIRVAMDEWVWPTGLTGGRARLLAIDGRVEEVFDEQGWTYKGHWIYATVGPFKDFPDAPNRPIRRHREIVLDIAVTTPAA